MHRRITLLIIMIICSSIVSAEGTFRWAHPAPEKFEINEIQTGDTTFDIISNGESWFTCNEATVNQPLPLPQTLLREDRARAAKFICAKKDNFVYLECCNPSLPDVNELSCKNKDFAQQRIVSAGGTTKQIASSLTKTLLSSGDALRIENSDEDSENPNPQIKNWQGYTHLDVIFKVSKNYNVFIEIANNENVLFSGKLVDYVQNSPGLNKFMVARIPINLGQISRIDFRYDSTTENILTINAINLIQGPSLYCTTAGYNPGRINSLWISDLDNKEPGATSGSAPPQPAGKSACIGAFGWTGTKCCGDDARESFADTEAGCWNSEFISKSVMDVKIGPSTFVCTSESCSYPSAPSLEHPLAYTVKNTADFSVASNIPQQVLFDANAFYGCLRSSFTQAGNIDFTNKDVQLCSTKNSVVCSPLTRGWSPSTVTNPKLKPAPSSVNLLKNPRFDE